MYYVNNNVYVLKQLQPQIESKSLRRENDSASCYGLYNNLLIFKTMF